MCAFTRIGAILFQPRLPLLLRVFQLPRMVEVTSTAVRKLAGVLTQPCLSREPEAHSALSGIVFTCLSP